MAGKPKVSRKPQNKVFARKVSGVESEQDNHSTISVDPLENPHSINGDFELPKLIEKPPENKHI